MKNGGYGSRELIIRVNAPQTPWGEADLSAAIEAKPDAILMPKVSSPAVLESIADRLESLDAPEEIRIWAMIETPASILNIHEIAKARRDSRNRLACFVLGTNDLSKDTWAKIVPGRAPFLPWMMTALAAARSEGLTILDGVFNDIADTEGCRKVLCHRPEVPHIRIVPLVAPSADWQAREFLKDRRRGRRVGQATLGPGASSVHEDRIVVLQPQKDAAEAPARP